MRGHILNVTELVVNARCSERRIYHKLAWSESTSRSLRRILIRLMGVGGDAHLPQFLLKLRHLFQSQCTCNISLVRRASDFNCIPHDPLPPSQLPLNKHLQSSMYFCLLSPLPPVWENVVTSSCPHPIHPPTLRDSTLNDPPFPSAVFMPPSPLVPCQQPVNALKCLPIWNKNPL